MPSPMYKLWLVIRSTLFWPPFLLVTVMTALILCLLMIFPFSIRIAVVRLWINISLGLLQVICGLKYVVEGTENIPKNGFIVMSKHSSTWETIALQKFFDPMIWVVKRELTWIPIFGWGLIAVDAIALNRGTGRKAINQLIEQSKKRMDEGRILMLFPEGTRVMPKQEKPFKAGGAIVSHRTGYAVLPIAHNAGEYWPRHSWIKWPGTIRVVIGKPIDPEGKEPAEIIGLVKDWIISTGEEISDPKQLEKIGIS
jgi:1-acyl-sn-glycerol-3-phosphate acyltransferase